jgi:hypothetical protein
MMGQSKMNESYEEIKLGRLRSPTATSPDR